MTGEIDPDDLTPRLSPERQAILTVLKAADKPLSPREVAKLTWAEAGPVSDRHVHAITTLLRRLEADKLVVNPAYGRYQIAPA